MKQLLLLTLILAPAGFGQTTSNGSLRVQCIKAQPGKEQELRAHLLDTTAKSARLRIESGMYSTYVIAEAVAPQGRAARCDYHLVAGMPGRPVEPKGITDEELKKAGINMTVQQRNAKRNEISYLVSTEYWQVRDFVGSSKKGGYVRLNYFKVKASESAEWLRMERSGWKQLAEAFAKAAPGTAWGLYTLGMPGGTSLPYNALTADIVPDWDGLFTSSPRQTWTKVHPEMDFTTYMNRLGVLADRPRVETLRLLEVMSK